MPDSVYDVAIIGAGTAGLTAAIYACRANKSVLVFEAAAPGGQILSTSKIENYPAAPNISGSEFATTLFNQASELGAKIEFAKVTNITKADSFLFIKTDSAEFKSRSLIIATGTSPRPRTFLLRHLRRPLFQKPSRRSLRRRQHRLYERTFPL